MSEIYKKLKLTREELFQMVWNRPTIHVAAELGVSDVMIGKMCRRMDVPKPPLGYWRKKETGTIAGQTPLPIATESTVDSVSLNRTKIDSVEAPFSSELRKLISNEELPKNKIRLPSCLEDAHPLVERARQWFEKKDCSQNGVVELPQGEGFLNVSVSRPFVDRALRIADALIKALEARGYSLVVSKDYWSGEATRIRKEGVEIDFSLFEQINKVRRKLTADERKKPPYLIVSTHENQSTCKLSIKIHSNCSSYKIWRDKLDEALEDRLNEVIIRVILMIEPLVLAKRVKLEMEKRRVESLCRADEERRKVEEFEKDAFRWAECNTLREYLKAYRAKLAVACGNLRDGSEEAIWLKWAECYVDKIDPLNSITNEDK